MAAKACFAGLPDMLGRQVPDVLRPQGRSKRPPRDRFNSPLRFGYAPVQSLVHCGILAVRLEPAFGAQIRPLEHLWPSGVARSAVIHPLTPPGVEATWCQARPELSGLVRRVGGGGRTSWGS